MDLLSGLRKGDSSRGGRAEFSWDQVKEDKDRENYLGHSLMAPVGRWQAKKDLTWYTKADITTTAEELRREEIRQIKEAENSALSEALGYPIVRRQTDLLNQNDVKRAIRDAVVGDENREGLEQEGRGIGFGEDRRSKQISDDQDHKKIVDKEYHFTKPFNDVFRQAKQDRVDRQRRHGHSWGRELHEKHKSICDTNHRNRYRRDYGRHTRSNRNTNRPRPRNRSFEGRGRRTKEQNQSSPYRDSQKRPVE